jgi:hypothetical protein
MENANWIEIVTIAAVGATAKEFVSAFIRHTAKQAATLKKKVAKLAANQWHRIDGGMDILQSLFQGWLASVFLKRNIVLIHGKRCQRRFRLARPSSLLNAPPIANDRPTLSRIPALPGDVLHHKPVIAVLVRLVEEDDVQILAVLALEKGGFVDS